MPVWRCWWSCENLCGRKLTYGKPRVACLSLGHRKKFAFIQRTLLSCSIATELRYTSSPQECIPIVTALTWSTDLWTPESGQILDSQWSTAKHSCTPACLTLGKSHLNEIPHPLLL